MSHAKKYGFGNWTFNGNDHANVISHGHEYSIGYHMKVVGLAAAKTNYILFDISDPTNYKHLSSRMSYFHFEQVDIGVDPAAAAQWEISLGFLENVDATNGDFTVMKRWLGTKQADRYLPLTPFKLSPDGYKCSAAFFATHDISANDADFQTDVTLATILDPGSADTAPGDGDVVLRVELAAGEIDFEFDFSGHTH